MFNATSQWPSYPLHRKPTNKAARLGAILTASFICTSAWAQQAPVIVQPGAPGQPSKTLPASTRPTPPPVSHADVEFMQGMIMHHSQAVEMTALIASHTQNKAVRSLGAKISSSQSDEIRFMKRWLIAHGAPVSMAMPGMPDMDMSGQPMPSMPGMLTPEQMEALDNAKKRGLRPPVLDRDDSAPPGCGGHGERPL